MITRGKRSLTVIVVDAAFSFQSIVVLLCTEALIHCLSLSLPLPIRSNLRPSGNHLSVDRIQRSFIK